MEKKDLKIVFFGTPEFAVASLDRLVQGGFTISAVVTMPDKVGGRGHKIIESDVKKYAVGNGLKLLQPEKLKSPEFIEELRNINADLFIVIAFRMLPEVVWGMPHLGTFNLHASLLPKYRGAAPINRAVMNGEKETGITTFFLKHEIDTGDIIEQRKIEIKDSDNAGIVHDTLMNLGAEMVESTVNSILEGTLNVNPQPEGEFIAAPKIFKEDCIIDWNKSAEEIHNHIRGLAPYPGSVTKLKLDNGKEMEIKIFESKISRDLDKLGIGEIWLSDRKMYVGTSVGALEILALQPSGKRRMDASDFLLGYNPIGVADIKLNS